MTEVIKTPIRDLFIVKPKVFTDNRGFFFESYHSLDFNKVIGSDIVFVQDNHSFSKKNVLRGLHFQLNKPQGKLIRVCNGSIFDVAVDLRKDSETYLKWFGCELSKKNRNQLWIPPGFAHGFICLSDVAEVLYKTTEFWYPEDEHTIIWNDKTINILWPNSITPIISDKDKEGKELTSFF